MNVSLGERIWHTASSLRRAFESEKYWDVRVQWCLPNLCFITECCWKKLRFCYWQWLRLTTQRAFLAKFKGSPGNCDITFEAQFSNFIFLIQAYMSIKLCCDAFNINESDKVKIQCWMHYNRTIKIISVKIACFLNTQNLCVLHNRLSVESRKSSN